MNPMFQSDQEIYNFVKQNLYVAAVCDILDSLGYREQAMHQRFRERLETALQQMQQSAATGRLKDAALAQRRWGRLQQRYWRAAKAFEATITPLERPEGQARLTIPAGCG